MMPRDDMALSYYLQDDGLGVFRALWYLAKLTVGAIGIALIAILLSR